MAEHAGKPKVRFAGFTEAWEQRKLGEIADKVTEKNTTLRYTEALTNSAEFGIIGQRDFFDHDVAKLSSLHGYYIVKEDDFVYNPRISVTAPVGPVNRNKLGKIGVVSPRYTVLRTAQIDNEFLEWFFKSACWHSFMIFNGDSGARSDRFSIKNSTFFEMPIPCPCRMEQVRIGTFFRHLDRLIPLHQCNCNMATRPCEWSSGLRAIAWEQRKLGEVGTTFTGLSGKKASDFGHGKASLITYMNVFSNPIANPNMIENVEVDSRQREVEVEDVFFTTSSETPEEVGMSSVLKKKIGITYLNSFCFGFRPSVKFDLDYLAFMLRSESVRKQIKLLAQGISRFNIAKTKMMYIDIQVPKIDEQIAIGKYFAQLDRLITLHQRKHILLT